MRPRRLRDNIASNLPQAISYFGINCWFSTHNPCHILSVNKFEVVHYTILSIASCQLHPWSTMAMSVLYPPGSTDAHAEIQVIKVSYWRSDVITTNETLEELSQNLTLEVTTSLCPQRSIPGLVWSGIGLFNAFEQNQGSLTIQLIYVISIHI
jgi:hypothetical protein